MRVRGGRLSGDGVRGRGEMSTVERSISFGWWLPPSALWPSSGTSAEVLDNIVKRRHPGGHWTRRKCIFTQEITTTLSEATAVHTEVLLVTVDI